MPKIKRICRVCGKSYTTCQPPELHGIHRWTDVACSKECYTAYMDAALRRTKPKEQQSQ